MASTEDAKKIIREVSSQDIDGILRSDSFTNEVEESVRGHIHQELVSWFFFRKLAADCARSNVALHGFSMLWERSAAECFADAHWLEKYLVQRGGRSKPTNIAAPSVEWPDSPVEPVEPVREAVKVEKDILDDLQRLSSLAGKVGDHSLTEAVETHFLQKESKHVKDLGDLLRQVVRVSKQPGHGIYQLDAELRAHKGRIPWSTANDPNDVDAIGSLASSLANGLYVGNRR